MQYELSISQRRARRAGGGGGRPGGRAPPDESCEERKLASVARAALCVGMGMGGWWVGQAPPMKTQSWQQGRERASIGWVGEALPWNEIKQSVGKRSTYASAEGRPQHTCWRHIAALAGPRGLGALELKGDGTGLGGKTGRRAYHRDRSNKRNEGQQGGGGVTSSNRSEVVAARRGRCKPGSAGQAGLAGAGNFPRAARWSAAGRAPPPRVKSR